MKKLLAIHYRPPLKNGRNNSFGQYYIHKTLEKFFDVRGIAFGEKDEKLDNFQLVQLSNSSFTKIVKFLFALQSVRLTHLKSCEFREVFQKEVSTLNPDYIYVEHVFMMQYLIGVTTRAKVILYDDDSFFYASENKIKQSLFQRFRNFGLAEYEIKAICRADYTMTITDQETNFLKDFGFKNICTLPYGIDTGYFTYSWGKPKENSILFVGNFEHYPNREAVKFLVENILPGLRNINCKLRIIGRKIDKIKKYLTDEIEVFENVADVRPFYWDASLFIAPIFSGAGLRIKVLEAASCGTPIVLSPLANLGIGFNEMEANLCNDVKEFVEAINFVLNKNKSKLIEQTELARSKINSEFSVEAVSEITSKIWNSIIT